MLQVSFIIVAVGMRAVHGPDVLMGVGPAALLARLIVALHAKCQRLLAQPSETRLQYAVITHIRIIIRWLFFYWPGLRQLPPHPSLQPFFLKIIRCAKGSQVGCNHRPLKGAAHERRPWRKAQSFVQGGKGTDEAAQEADGGLELGQDG